METAELQCEMRETHTKGEVRALRRAGKVPAIVYGPKTRTMALVLAENELKARIATASKQRVLKLRSAAGELNDRYVILKQIQRGPLKGELLHADLYEIDLQQKLVLAVPLKFAGKAKGVADGGILQPLVREVDVECLPLEIPEFVEVDVTELGIHDVIHVSSIKFSGNVKPIFDNDYAVVSVLPPTVAEAPVAAAAAVEGAPAEGAAAEGAPAAGAAGKEGEAAGKEAAGGKKEAGKK